MPLGGPRRLKTERWFGLRFGPDEMLIGASAGITTGAVVLVLVSGSKCSSTLLRSKVPLSPSGPSFTLSTVPERHWLRLSTLIVVSHAPSKAPCPLRR